MTNLLQTGSDFLADRLKTHASKTVTYRRGAQTLSLSAVIGRTEFELDGGGAGLIKIESRDFLIHAADLVFDGATTTPRRGDVIEETQGADVFIYEVMDLTGEPHWRYSDDHRKLLRIHTKQVQLN